MSSSLIILTKIAASTTAIKAISPFVFGLSFLLPLLYGLGKKKFLTALISGWALAIIAARFHDYIAPRILLYSTDIDNLVLPIQSDVALTFHSYYAGWILPTAGYFLGKKLRDRRTSK